jgi:hypothetical protein
MRKFITSIFRMMKSRMMRWAGHVERIGEKKMNMGYRWVSRNERDHWEDQFIGEWTILKWIFRDRL